MKKNLFAAALALGLMAVSSASGALIMTIDSSAKTFWLSGSDSGTTGDDGQVGWTIAIASTATQWVVGSLFDVSGVPTAGSQYLALFGSSGGAALSVGALGANYTPVTFTGTETAYSYASFDAASIAELESWDGKTLSLSSLTKASGFSNIAVNVVPEPTSAALLGLGAAALALRRRRRA